MFREDIYKFFSDLIYKKTGMVYSPQDYYRLDSRLVQLMNHFQISTGEELMNLYSHSLSNERLTVLINIATNNETYFFRDVKPFSVLAKKIMPELIKANPAAEHLIWSAACSTGQELYSILMALKNALSEDEFKKILSEGSDISQQALVKAKSAIYNGLDVQRGLPAPMLVKYFEQLDPEKWKIKAEIMNKSRFFDFNLLTGLYPSARYSVVFCRNILIYQDKENKELILQSIYKSLRPGGYMILGSGESLIGHKTEFEHIIFDDFSAYKKL